jgi:hypothetical protein
MSKIFELFGFRLDTWGDNAQSNLKKAWCPFMDNECDGGGNRYLSAIDLTKIPKLAAMFPGKNTLQSGVCSLRIRENEQPWIVCPRRLLSFKCNSENIYQEHVKSQIYKYMEIYKIDRYKVWSEVKMKVTTTTDEDQEKNFDYTFDYVITGTKKIKVSDAAALLNTSTRSILKTAANNSLTIAKRGDYWIEDFPTDPIIIIEIMTSSTSGGDKKKRTQISMAVEDSILDRNKHNGPGINYRQVWARMVSQLIVKSQVGLAWNGKAIWLIQDVLADYISSSTALDLSKYLSDEADEVNIISAGYGDMIDKNPVHDDISIINTSTFHSGPIASNSSQTDKLGFVEIIKIGAAPNKKQLWRSLFLKKPCYESKQKNMALLDAIKF